MTLYERIWREAAETFGKNRGHGNPLTPYTRTWRQVIDRAEHALWLWNDKYGPLTAKQREYAGDLICHALVAAREAPDPGSVYAYFNTRLTEMLNHERAHQGFRARENTDPERRDNALLDLDVFQVAS